MLRLLPAFAAVIFSSGAASAAPRTRPAPATRPAAVATVSRIDGEDIRIDDRRAKAGWKLWPGSRLEVPRGARVWVDFAAGGSALFDGPARARMALAGREGIVLKAGRFLARLVRPRARFTVRTPTVEAAVRGTDFFVETLSPQETYVCACAGRVRVTAKGGLDSEITGTHHKAYRFVASGANILQTDAPLERHSDEDLATLR